MTDLSPAARALVAAFDARYELCGPFDDNWQELCLAAALRAAACQLTSAKAIDTLRAIANELDLPSS